MLTAIVSTDTVSVRTGRGRFFSKLGQYFKNDIVTVLDDTLGKDFVKVAWTVGYAYSAKGTYIKLIDSTKNISQDVPNAVVTGSISVRKGRGLNYVKLGVQKDGDQITVLEDPKKNDYVKVVFSVGYVHSKKGKNLRLVGSPMPLKQDLIPTPVTAAIDAAVEAAIASGEAAAAPNAIVTANAISVRTGRGEDYAKLGEYTKDDQIVVRDDTLAHDYVHVNWQDGDGYAYCDFGKYINFIYFPPEVGLNAVVAANRISVREGRGESFPKLGAFKKDDRIIVLDDTLDYEYVRVVFNDTEGFAYCDFGKYIRFTDIPTPADTNAIVVANRISVRESRGLNYPKLGEFYKGDNIIVLDDMLDYDYVHVVWQDGDGYAYCDFGQHIKFTHEQQGQIDCRATEPNAIVTASRINIREGRGVQYPKIGEFVRGDNIVVLDETLDYEYVQVACQDTVAYAYCDFGQYIRMLDPDTPDEIARTIDIVASCVGGKYIYGGQGKKITVSYVRQQRAKYPEYFTGGRYEFLLEIGKRCDTGGVWQYPADYCWDCSGLWWYSANKAGIYGKNIDTTANTFYHTYCVPIGKEALVAGDAVFYRNSSGRITHMGIVGFGGVVHEAMSGYVGVITGDSVDDRTAPRIVGTGTYTRRAWNAYGRPKLFIK